jgi:hypothetical protein
MTGQGKQIARLALVPKMHVAKTMKQENVEEEQNWQVSVSGWEISELDAKKGKEIRTAVRFEYKLGGEFTIVKVKGKWQYKGGKTTASEVKYEQKYEPPKAWRIEKVECPKCFRVTNMKDSELRGNVDEEDKLLLSWEYNEPDVSVDAARVEVPGMPKPSDTGVYRRWHKSFDFFQRIRGEHPPLRDGGTVSPHEKVIEPGSGEQALDYTCTLHLKK